MPVISPVTAIEAFHRDLVQGYDAWMRELRGLVLYASTVSLMPGHATPAFYPDLVQGYDAWMRELRGLASVTRSTRTTQALEFLTELGPRGEQESLAQLGVRDIDAYLQQRCKGLRRRTIEGYTVCLRSFLRYAFEAFCAIC